MQSLVLVACQGDQSNLILQVTRVTFPPENTRLGRLSIEQVLIDYDGPQLFVAVDSTGARLLGLHVFMDELSDRWLYVHVSPGRLADLFAARIDLRAAFAQPESGAAELMEISDRGTFVETLLTAAIPPDFLPTSGEYFEGGQRAGSFRNSAPLLLSDWIRASSGLPEPILQQTPLWEERPEVLAYLRSIRTPVAVAATRTGRMVADIILQPGENRVDVSVVALGSILTIAQKLVDALTQESKDAIKGPLKASVREWTKLDAVAVFSGSFGLRIETHTGGTIPTEGRLAFERLIQLLSAGANPERVRERLADLSTRAANHYKAFAKAIVKSESSLQIAVGFPHEQERQAQISAEEVRALTEFLDQEVPQSEEIITVHGSLVAVSLPTKFFRIEVGETAYSGRIADDCMPKINQKKIGVRHSATLTVLTELNEISGEESHKYLLTDIEEV